MSDPRRAIPAVERLLSSPAFAPLLARAPRAWVTDALQTVQARVRAALGGSRAAGPELADPAWYAARVEELLAERARPSLRPVINATGVVLHTNLGRALLPDAARAALDVAARRYTNLEYDLERGERGSRYVHCAALLEELTGAEAALVVNNNAAAVLLALNTLAADGEAVVSRGELVEIGGSFRIPEVLSQGGARLVEVGTTNKTRLDDYRAALGPETALLLKVHRSNYRLVGFTEEVDLEALVGLGREAGIPVMFDAGSGALVDLGRWGIPVGARVAEELARASLELLRCFVALKKEMARLPG